MTQSSERDKYPFLTDQERARKERVETVNVLRLDELEVGDRVAVLARKEPKAESSKGTFTLEVSSKEQLQEGENIRTKVTFRYYPVDFFGLFQLYTERGETMQLPDATTLESGFSSISDRTMQNWQPIKPDYNRIKTGESYWFGNAGGTGQVAIARGVSTIGLLRKVNM